MAPLVLGVGARAQGTTQELSELIVSVLASHDLSLEHVLLLATLDRRSGHPALVAVAEGLAVPVKPFDVETLAAVATPTPSELVLARTGTSGVSEAAVLATGAQIIVNKQSSDNFTVAVGSHPLVVTTTATATTTTTTTATTTSVQWRQSS